MEEEGRSGGEGGRYVDMTPPMRNLRITVKVCVRET